MGSGFSRKLSRFWSRNERRVLLVGLDAAGKTTILYHLRLHKTIPTIPTIGFNVETFQFQGLTLNLWDVGGQDTLRPYWRHHFTGTQGIVFVIDSSDATRLELAKAELHGVLHDEQLHHACLLVLLNKKDLLEEGNSVENIISALDFQQQCDEKGRKFHVQPTVATTGEGLNEGFTWLCQHMAEL